MSVLTQDQLKALFETADTPTQQDFTDLIDTLETNSAVISTAVAGTGDVWTDVNSNNAIVQTTKQINVIKHNGTYYLFNAGVGSFGLGGTATVSSNFVAISNPLIEGTIPVQLYTFTNPTQDSTISISPLVTQINTSETLTHTTNQVTVVKYKSAYLYKPEAYYLFTGDAGTYGFGNTQVGSSNFIDLGVNDPINNTSVSVQTINNPSGDIWTFVNANTNIQVLPGDLRILYYGTKVYLFNPSLDAFGNPQIYGVGQIASSASNYRLLLDTAPTYTDGVISITEADYILGTGINLDFSGVDNIEVSVAPGTDQVLAVSQAITATNFEDNASGWIRFSKADGGLGATNLLFSSDFIVHVSNPAIIDANNIVYYKYKVIPSYTSAPKRILLTEMGGESSVWV